MSGQSPSVVLYTSAGTELDVQNNTAIPTGTGAILISGVTPAGNSTWNPASSDGILGITQMANHQVAQNAAVTTASGSFTTTLMFAGAQEIVLVVDAGTVTGAGNITYSIQEIDTVGNLYGNSASTAAISTGNAPGVFTAVLNVTTAMNFRVTWTVSGTFSSTITSYVVSKSTPSTQTVNGTITASNPSISTTGTAVPASATFVGGLVTTAAESGLVNGDLYALNMTTTGQLRIDGVYPLATAVATAVDMGQVGGVVTTAAPTYTTATVNALSLDTSGNLRVTGSGGTFNNASVSTTGTAVPASATFVGGLVTTAAESGLTSGDLYALNLTTTGQLRIDGVYPLATAVATAVDMNQVGGVVTTAAPTYTTATTNALSLDTSGNLRTLSNQGLAGTLAQSWFTRISDGTNGPAAVKPASTAAVATDPALVVAISPNNTITTTNLSVGATGAAPPADATYMGALATTAAESGLTTGDMYPLNLTTTGQLRIDGVYPLATAVATAVDMNQVGGVVTTAAPTYTTATTNALSLTTSGLLRIDSVYPVGTANASAPDVGNSGGYVTTAAPTYTTGQLNPLSLDTSGNLRVTGFVTTNKSTTAAVTSVAVPATTATSLLAANATRIFASLYNNGTKGTIYILLGAGTVSAANFSIAILANSYWELPVDWTGAVSAFATNASTVLCTELTP